MTTKISATELARNLSDILNRVRYKGESFVVERNGEAVAILKPEPGTAYFTVADFQREFGNLKVPPGLADTIEDARRALRLMPEPPFWP